MYRHEIMHRFHHVILITQVPDCASTKVVKNGMLHNGKQNHKCNACGRQFVKDPQNKIIDDATTA